MKETIETKVLCYRGNDPNPKRLDTEQGIDRSNSYSALFSTIHSLMYSITADLHELYDKLQPRVTSMKTEMKNDFIELTSKLACCLV